MNGVLPRSKWSEPAGIPRAPWRTGRATLRLMVRADAMVAISDVTGERGRNGTQRPGATEGQGHSAHHQVAPDEHLPVRC